MNPTDSPGDEGAIFSALVRGNDLTETELQQLKAEDDGAIALLDGEERAIEMNSTGGVIQSDYDALVAFYNSANGDGWRNNGNWLTDADVSEWAGVTVEGDRVIQINLTENNLVGTLPAELGNLDNLRYLWLSNNEFTGSIPTELGNLDNLLYLGLSNNELEGSIPTELGNLDNLLSLWLYNNELTGSIPTELGNLDNLQFLGLSNNELTGSIPAALGEIQSLRFLQLDNNRLMGTIPTTIADRSFSELHLENPPYIANAIPNQTIFLNDEVEIDLSGNFADLNDDSISYSVEGLPEGLNLDGSTGIITGETSSSGNYTVTVTGMDKDGEVETSFQLVVPTVVERDYNALVALYNSTNGAGWTNNSNWLTDADVSEWHGVTVEGDRVTGISLRYNDLVGTLPAELGNLDNLQYLLLDQNQLTGFIPTELGNLVDLQYLYLYSNQLEGSIPSELGNLVNLQYLYLYSNQLEGSIPSELGNLVNLQHLGLRNNQLEGSIPSELGNLVNLQHLGLRNNQSEGSIPSELGNLVNLQSLMLSNNELTGSIPAALGEIQSLRSLRLENNRLTGTIPTTIADRSFQELNLENPPYVASVIPNQNIPLNEEVEIDLSGNFADLNEDSISYSARGLPEGLNLNASTGIITGATSGSGTYTVTVTGTDNDGGVETSFQLVVSNDPLIVGTSNQDILTGGRGNDTLRRLGGKDILNGGAGADVLRGGSGKDILNGGAGADVLRGGNGRDKLNGQAGADTLVGGKGNDIYIIDIKDTVVDSNGIKDTIRPNFSADLADFSGIENIALRGKKNISATGDGNSNKLVGNKGDNLLRGEEGDDTLLGGSGNDTLVGGDGLDSFQFNELTPGIDQIADFNVADDTILVNGANFGGGLLANASITAPQLNLGSSATEEEHRFFYDSIHGGLWFDGDGSNSGGAIQLGVLPTGLALTHSDIYVI